MADLAFVGFWWRFLATGIDSVILTLMIRLLDSALGAMALQAVAAVGGMLYYAGFECSAWQATPGKMICHLVVTDEAGGRISFGRALWRNVAKIASTALLFIGYMLAGWTVRKQVLHDLMAKCLVMRGRVESPDAARSTS
jgi:uncharacterized RDD family membrane protein YckC